MPEAWSESPLKGKIDAKDLPDFLDIGEDRGNGDGSGAAGCAIMRHCLRTSVFLSRCFCYAWDRHLNRRHNAEYEVCRHQLCRLAWFVENLLWYGGEIE